ncbi:methylated-DNA--[protein]-cysteine S-methyltransferase [Paracoccus kondratievae]|uniref:methylated-DNA--[protein]-cysteine S-methyltransferase n=1 Tax=Paracoccus kondratievae TaxID=135740 RepID=UPI001266666B|nr:methylated-DNA--[protein]-cysteine S-methyltransferase [Paracoccus kondratievae]QFQ86288.1 methylated-DNA--[protein]-cysteine S-methyltransferase [Paracoccus kondratievae]
MSAGPDLRPDPGPALAELLAPVSGGQMALVAAGFSTPLGGMIAVADDARLHLLEFVERKELPAELMRLHRIAGGGISAGRNAVIDRTEGQIAGYFAGTLAGFDLPLALYGTPFQQEVWQALQQIPPGITISYSELARRVGRPLAVRAAAGANGANQLAIVIPCHRVTGLDGQLTGYGGGLWRKRALLDHENRAYSAVIRGDGPRKPGEKA